MQITENEAWLIIGALNIAEGERGIEPEEQEFINRIRLSFPKIDATLTLNSKNETLWGEVVELDPRVKAIRQRLETATRTPEAKQHDRGALIRTLIDELHTMKILVYEELAPKYLDSTQRI